MEYKSEKHWDNISDFLSKVGDNLNILEEEVDVKVQKEYFDVAKKLSERPEKYQAICKKYIEHVNDLFGDKVSDDVKKRMLVILATVDDVAIYRAIESFSKGDTPLKKWAVVALQQSRMLIQSTLLDDPGVFISTGLGGQNGMLRYFCVFLNRGNEFLPEFQRDIVKKETEIVITKAKGVIEEIDFQARYTTMLILLPIDIDLKILFERIIDESNLYGNFLHENMIITNVKKLSEEEIVDILKGRKPDSIK